MAVNSIVTVFKEDISGENNSGDAGLTKFSKNPWSSFQDYRQKQLSIINLNGEQHLFIYNVNTRTSFKLKIIPDQMAESYASKIVSQTPFGVAQPLNYYVGGEAKQLSFSFDMHEDLHNTDGSIYTLLEDLKDMSRAKVINSTLKEPLVYFQLGKQFAGTGHLNVSYDYKKPFRQGRYIYITCSISFTFHEDFDADPVAFDDTLIADMSLGTQVDFSSLSSGFESIEDFEANTFDYDYIVSQIYTDSKIATYFNTVITNIESHYDDISKNNLAPDSSEVSAYIESISNGELWESNYNPPANDNTYSIELINLVFKFKTLINPVFKTSDIKANLIALHDTELNDLFISYNNSFQLDDNENPISDLGIGWYKQFTSINFNTSYTFRWVQMSESERTQFEEALQNLSDLVRYQLKLYSILSGAGD